MVKSFVFLLLCVGIILLDFKKAEAHSKSLGRGDNGGLPCATCTILLSISSQMAQIYNETTVESLTRLCTFLPKTYQGECEALVEYLAPIIDKEIDEHFTVDVVCYSIGLCYVDPGRKMCNLFPLPPNLQLPAKSAQAKKIFNEELILKAFPWICYLPGIYRLCEALSDTYTKLLPAIDLDGDKFSSVERLRGSVWRGRDCSDFDDQYRPGRQPLNNDLFGDSNCNGIFGVNDTSGNSLETELCGGSDAKGIVYIGDSVGAHFHVPPTWFTPSKLTTGILTNVSYVISNEFDWPDVGFATGFRNATQMPDLIFDNNGKFLFFIKRM